MFEEQDFELDLISIEKHQEREHTQFIIDKWKGRVFFK